MKKNAPTSASKVINLGRISLTFLLTNKDRISYLNAQWTQGLKWRENSKRVEYFVLYCTDFVFVLLLVLVLVSTMCTA